MNSTPKNEAEIKLHCTEHYSTEDAFYITSCLASFLQISIEGMLHDMVKEGTPSVLDDAMYGMNRCFALLQDMLLIAEKESSKGGGAA